MTYKEKLPLGFHGVLVTRSTVLRPLLVGGIHAEIFMTQNLSGPDGWMWGVQSMKMEDPQCNFGSNVFKPATILSNSEVKGKFSGTGTESRSGMRLTIV